MTNTRSARLVLIRLAIACVLLFCSQVSHAYFMTGHEEYPLGDGALFQIEYTFGTAKHDVLLPVMTNYGDTKSEAAVSYQILDREGHTVAGTASGIVLSSTPLHFEDSVYRIKKGTAKKMYLTVAFVPETLLPKTPYRLQVTHLPFNFDGTQQLQLNPSELQYYTTDFVNE